MQALLWEVKVYKVFYFLKIYTKKQTLNQEGPCIYLSHLALHLRITDRDFTDFATIARDYNLRWVASTIAQFSQICSDVSKTQFVCRQDTCSPT